MSNIIFNVRPSQGWDPKTNLVDKVIYVLCLLAEKDHGKLNPLKTEQWQFWIVPTKILNALEAEVGPGVGFEELKAEVDRCVSIDMQK